MRKNKQPRRSQNPEARGVVADNNPDAFFNEKPAWQFCLADKEKWSPILQREVVAGKMISAMLNFEGMTWNQILSAKKKNHPIDIRSLNQCAIKRLEELHIEAESLYSLRIQGTHRIYGLIQGDGTFQLIWYDTAHGDNDTCVCRSRKKHT